MTELKWKTGFRASEAPLISKDDIPKFVLKGILIDESENKNRWMVSKDDFGTLAKDFVGKQIRVDHGDKVSDVVGIITSTEVDAPHDQLNENWDPPNQFSHIHFAAEISTTDQSIIIPIRQGFVDHVSPTIDARALFCSKCGQNMVDKNMQSCNCKDTSILIKDMEARELSIVASPAYKNTSFVTYGFAASGEKVKIFMASEILDIIEDELKRRSQ